MLTKEEQARCDEWFQSWIQSDSFHDDEPWKQLVERIWEAAIDAKDAEIEDLKWWRHRVQILDPEEVESVVRRFFSQPFVRMTKFPVHLKVDLARFLNWQFGTKDAEIKRLMGRVDWESLADSVSVCENGGDILEMADEIRKGAKRWVKA